MKFTPVRIPQKLVESTLLVFGAGMDPDVFADPREELWALMRDDTDIACLFSVRIEETTSGRLLVSQHQSETAKPLQEQLSAAVNSVALASGCGQWIIGKPSFISRKMEPINFKARNGKEYVFSLEKGEEIYQELEPLGRAHYGEMKQRLMADGMEIGEWAPRSEEYIASERKGNLKVFIVRHEGRAIGYSNMYITNDMHNGELICTEDAIYILPEHRGGVGLAFMKNIIRYMKNVGVKRVMITPVTDLRAESLWARIGFKKYASLMVCDLEGKEFVRLQSSNSHDSGRPDDDEQPSGLPSGSGDAKRGPRERGREPSV
jgi:L-amino acid N-acyltransferase YncA